MCSLTIGVNGVMVELCVQCEDAMSTVLMKLAVHLNCEVGRLRLLMDGERVSEAVTAGSVHPNLAGRSQGH